MHYCFKTVITSTTNFFNETNINFRSLYAQVKITSGGEGKCTAEFTVSSEHLNRLGGLHGGFTATLVDMVTTYALMSKPCHPGVSVSISVDYLKAAKEGDDVLIDANLLKAGKKLAFLECILKHKKDNSIIAKGSHTKYVDFQ